MKNLPATRLGCIFEMGSNNMKLKKVAMVIFVAVMIVGLLASYGLQFF